jgi:hypothetical protein
MRAGGAKVASVVSSRLWLSTIARGFSTANNRCRISLGLEITGYQERLISMAQKDMAADCGFPQLFFAYS